MGRATILEHIGDALYRVNIHRDSPRVTATIGILRTEASATDAKVAAKQAELVAAESAMFAAKSAYEADQTQINQNLADPEIDQADQISKLLPDYLQALAKWEGIKTAVLALEGQAEHLRNKADTLEAETAPRETTAWCSHYKTDIPVGSVVATIEVARQGEDFPHHVIDPTGRAATTADGQMRSIMSMTPAQCYLNYALWPGAVKWRGRFSSGTVLEINKEDQLALVSLKADDVAGLWMHPEGGDVQWLPYKNPCPDGHEMSGYIVGDRVIVIIDEEYKRIIGWADRPRPCTDWRFISLGDGIWWDWNDNTNVGYVGPENAWRADGWNGFLSQSIQNAATHVHYRLERTLYYQGHRTFPEYSYYACAVGQGGDKAPYQWVRGDDDSHTVSPVYPDTSLALLFGSKIPLPRTPTTTVNTKVREAWRLEMLGYYHNYVENGNAPSGPTGWTKETLHAAIDDPTTVFVFTSYYIIANSPVSTGAYRAVNAKFAMWFDVEKYPVGT